MCSICGILGRKDEKVLELLQDMNQTMALRGPDQYGYYQQNEVGFAHNRLSIMDLERGKQPMTRTMGEETYTIVYNGEIYNGEELIRKLKQKGVSPTTHCDTELVLLSYMHFGMQCAQMLNGIFAFAIHHQNTGEVYIARDRFGVKPFFYGMQKESMVFASEIKALMKYPGMRPVVKQRGVWELLMMSPARLNGGIFADVMELPSAHHGVWKEGILTHEAYWTLEAKPFEGTRSDAIANTKFLLEDAIKRQLVSDVPLCTLLSGGLDSSIISAVAANHEKQKGKVLTTYSFEYENNTQNFKQSLFQPQSDDVYARYMGQWLGTDHQVLSASTQDVFDHLPLAVDARDFPGQADIDSSLLYYCKEIKKRHTVALSGECADEIFGGYPWFYRPEMIHNPFFPWIHDPMARAKLFLDSFAKAELGFETLSREYQTSMAQCPVLDSDSPSMRQSRLATWLSVQFFMASLLERKDRMSMAASVEVRVPFADHCILEYVYNVPWNIKRENGVEKSLLRNAMKDWLPDKILNRKKSPYPKTQDPLYEQILISALEERMHKSYSMLGDVIKKDALERFLRNDGATWYGQLMAKPQLLAWLLQLDHWVEKAHVTFDC